VQLVLLVILALAFVNYIVGSFLPPSEIKRARGFVGYSGSLLFTFKYFCKNH